MKASTIRFWLFFMMTIVFCLWLAFLSLVVIYSIQNPDSMDAATGVVSGLGLGAVLGFFISVLTLGWQFYFRKVSKEEQVTSGQ